MRLRFMYTYSLLNVVLQLWNSLIGLGSLGAFSVLTGNDNGYCPPACVLVRNQLTEVVVNCLYYVNLLWFCGVGSGFQNGFAYVNLVT